MTCDHRDNHIPKMILEEIASQPIASHQDLIDAIKKILGNNLICFIDSHNTPAQIALCRWEDTTYIVKAEYGNPPLATAKEIAWYATVGQNRLFVPTCFMTLINSTIAALVLEYIEGSITLDEYALELLDIESVNNFVFQSIHNLECIYAEHPQKTIHVSDSNALFIQKFWQRTLVSYSFPFL